ncbi:hypothetical protein CL644_00730 [bacterium]|nr:hypothetical protein [bacterium]|tara:strand:- start:1841 stop:3052 length:1212 start_codon:yes stop_codon:yes gene_type:complete
MISEQKIKKWVEIYLDHINKISIETHIKDEEGYKFQAVETFQKNFDIEAQDLGDMLDKSIIVNNLVVGAHYFPRKMLLIFASQFPDKTREILRNLFNEDKDIIARINEAHADLDRLMDIQNKELGGEAHSYAGLRFLSLLLGYHNPEAYNAMKPREWRAFAGYINDEFKIAPKTSEGDKYKILSEHTDALLEYIKGNEQIEKIRGSLTRGLDFDDLGYRWITQDVIYVTARLLKDEYNKEKEQIEKIEQVETSDEDNKDDNKSETIGDPEMQFQWEKELENFIVRNWERISIEEGLTLYEDEDGEIGQQYPTDSGAIDILATDKDNNFVVIELKKGRSGEKVVGQILHYMGWVKSNLATNGQDVRGIIIASDGSVRLTNAVGMVADKIQVKYYRVGLDFIDPK